MADALLTTAEAAARLAVAKHTLDVWRTLGKGPVFRKLGGRLVRYSQADLDAYVEAAGRANTGGIASRKLRPCGHLVSTPF